VDTIHEVETTDPNERLTLLLDQLLVELEDHLDLLVAILEMRSQAPYKAAFADRFEQNDEYVRYMLRTVIADGVRQGVFDEDVDPEHAAAALMTIVDGARTRAVVLDDADTLATARGTAEEYVDSVLRVDD